MIDKLINRTSVRHYLDKPIEQDKIDNLKKVINNSPTAKNFQDFSAIFVTDPKIKQIIANANYHQKHVANAPLVIIFCADHNLDEATVKKANLNDVQMDNIEQFLVALTDATIACNTCLNAALDMGLSTCTICGFRQNPEPVIKALNITGKCLPVIGLTIGYMAKKTPLRPKVDKTYKNTYDLNLIPNRLKEYDQIMKQYYTSIFNIDKDYSQINAESINSLNCPQMMDYIKKYFFNK